MRYRLQEYVNEVWKDTDVKRSTQKQLNEYIDTRDLNWRVGYRFSHYSSQYTNRWVWDTPSRKGEPV